MNPESKLEEAAVNTALNNASMDQHIRMKLVNTAAEFLSSPSVQSSSMDMKLSFLKKKGLTDAEIDLAIKQSDARLMATKDANPGMLPAVPNNSIVPVYYVPSRWTMFRDIANSAILLGGLVYGAYWTYTNIILPYFYGKKDKKDLSSQLSEHLTDVSTGLSKLREDIKKLSDNRTENIQKDISELKSEVSSLKKLLLNRKQFPIASNGQIGIPSWQIAENEEKQSQEEEGNGSNGSESSLEMIKE